MMGRIILILALCILIHQRGYSQIERPNQAYGIFNVEVSQAGSGGYLYEYDISNANSSLQVLLAFKIFIQDASFYTRTIESPEERKWYIDGLAKVHITGAAAGNTLNLPTENGLSPGESMNISFSSFGLPAIHPFYTKGFVEPWTEEYLASLFEAGYKREEIFLGWKKEWFQGTTISPKVWPDSTSLSTFIDTVEVYRHRSCTELGWATDPGVCGELEDDLSEVKTALESEDSLSAANALKRFIDLVEAEKDASLTSEGYALLYFNAEYLADRLTKPE